MWKHKTKWLVRGGRKVKCYLCGKKILASGDLFLFHGDTGYYSHQACQAESTTISGNERRRAVKKIAVGAAVVGAIAAGAGKFLDVSSQSKNSPATQTILTSQGLIPPALTSDPANPVPGQMWYRSDAGVMAHFDGVQNRVVYSSEINDGNVHVTSKGIINGLSVLPNDGTGWFGPDTTEGATSRGQIGSPYTETSGLEDALNYSESFNPSDDNQTYMVQVITNGAVLVLSRTVNVPNVDTSVTICSAGKRWAYMKVTGNFPFFTFGSDFKEDMLMEGFLLINAQTNSVPQIDLSAVYATNDIHFRLMYFQPWNTTAPGITVGTIAEITFDECYGGVSVSGTFGILLAKDSGLYGNNNWTGAQGQIQGTGSGGMAFGTALLYGCGFGGSGTSPLVTVAGNMDGIYIFGTYVGYTTSNAPWIQVNSGVTLNNLVLDGYNDIYPSSLNYSLTSNFLVNNGTILNYTRRNVTSTRPDLSPSTTNGTTAGTVKQVTYEYQQYYKKTVLYFSGYENDTTTNQSITFSLAFVTMAAITSNTTGLTITATTTGITITAPDNTTTYSGIVVVEGY